ncbi:hypothetical protein BCR35DRAFT_293795 [Leucosporidium creatinivorum]|uniref:Uncharacterized protein n=1 Tax=Leucosporidium creatinivorum TaxID=106004 RepID=A0A1Y2ENR9_9BASI|nr:hypothetical protein BCR35DRAFT_293795 [Leucosporidium creatinivorum]
MPVELLPFPPSYCIVGAYRLVTDDSLWQPIWKRSRKTLKRAFYLSIPFTLISYPLTRLYVTLILARSPFSPNNIHDAAVLGISVVRYTTMVLVLGQISMLLEWALRRELGKSKEEVYEATVRSRGKSQDFWGPYVEEWRVPPIERAQRAAQKASFYDRLASPLVRLAVIKVLLTPLSFIPGLSLVVTSAIRCLTLARTLHKPFFAAKKMSPFETELWLTERQTEYRLFGFVSSLMERVPLIGLVFSISNRIGAAMWAFDLEKHQHAYHSGELKPTKEYFSKTAAAAAIPSDLPEGAVGAFPTTKGPVRIEKDGSEVGAGLPSEMKGRLAGAGVPRPLPTRN